MHALSTSLTGLQHGSTSSTPQVIHIARHTRTDGEGVSEAAWCQCWVRVSLCAVTCGLACVSTCITMPHSFRKATKKTPGKFGQRYYKNVGLGFRTPRDAIEGMCTHGVVVFAATTFTGTYIDKKCPFTSNVAIRGRILQGMYVATYLTHVQVESGAQQLPTGVVKSTKMHRTIIVRRDYLHYIKKYQRFEKRHTNIAAHISPCFRAKEGDLVTIGQCRCGWMLGVVCATIVPQLCHNHNRAGRCPRRCVSTCCAWCHRGPMLARASKAFRHTIV